MNDSIPLSLAVRRTLKSLADMTGHVAACVSHMASLLGDSDPPHAPISTDLRIVAVQLQLAAQTIRDLTERGS